MDDSDVLAEAHEIDNQLEHIGEKKRSPLWYIIGIFMVLLLVVMVVPYYAVQADPRPSYTPLINEVIPSGFNFLNNSVGNSRADYLKLVEPGKVKPVADRIVSLSCDSYSRVCYAKAIFYFVRDEFDYVNDPLAFEYVKSASESLVTGGGDCDDSSVSAVNLLEAVGIRTRFVFVPRHVYVQALLPEALSKYKSDGDWVTLDLTCKSCEFGELPYQYRDVRKSYLG